MKSIEVSARTIEDAISDGLAKLGCAISDCKVEILQEGAKGLFGFFGSKPATVRLTLHRDEDAEDDLGINLGESLAADGGHASGAKRAPKPAPAQEKPAPKPRADKAAKSRGHEVLERFRSAPLPGNNGESQSEKPARARKPRAPKAAPAREPGAEAPAERQEAPERVAVPAPAHIQTHAPDTLEGIAQRFLLDVTQRMGVGVQVDVHISEDGHLYATMYGDTLGILIGRRGETLDALQYLTSLQVNRGREEYTRVTLDTENYRAKREEALSRLAARMANRAVKTGRRVSLEPMNPYERRILHASLQNNPNVTTHSEGDDPYRHVVIMPVK